MYDDDDDDDGGGDIFTNPCFLTPSLARKVLSRKFVKSFVIPRFGVECPCQLK